MKQKNEKGQALVFILLMFAILLFMVGLASDGGRAYLVRASMARVVDAAAIAAAAKVNSGGLTAAQTAACDSARMNGVTNCAILDVTQVTTNDAAGNPKSAVKVTANVATPTIFVAAGKLMGCTTCSVINVSVSAVAAGGGTLDIAVNLDDTASMKTGAPTWISQAKIGANALIDAVLPVSGSPTAMVSMVPFRGCYNVTGANDCKNRLDYPSGHIAPLTNTSSLIHNAVNALDGKGGSGTNNCEGLYESRIRLFQSGLARATAQKFLVLLSDTNSSYNPGNAGPYNVGPCKPSSGGTAEHKVNLLTYNIAQDIKNGTNVGTTGQIAGQTVKVFLIFYGDAGPAPVNCTPPPAGATSWNTDPINLGRCIASSAGDMYFAPTPSDVAAAFQQIINRLPVVLVN